MGTATEIPDTPINITEANELFEWGLSPEEQATLVLELRTHHGLKSRDVQRNFVKTYYPQDILTAMLHREDRKPPIKPGLQPKPGLAKPSQPKPRRRATAVAIEDLDAVDDADAGEEVRVTV